MKRIYEASEIPEGEKVYLRKDKIFGWRVVEPVIDPARPDVVWYKRLNWFNLITGGKKNIAFLIILLLIAGVFYLGFKEQVANYHLVTTNPCKYCQDWQKEVLKEVNKQYDQSIQINSSLFKGVIVSETER